LAQTPKIDRKQRFVKLNIFIIRLIGFGFEVEEYNKYYDIGKF